MITRTLTPEAIVLLEAMRGKMMLLYPPVDSASDEMMSEGRAPGVYAIGYSLRSQYWSLWEDWKKLEELVGFSGFGGGASGYEDAMPS